MILAALVAAVCIAVSMSYKIYDPDIWENLVVGKAIWTLRQIPKTQLWSWPTYGAPDVKWTWGFSALAWPVWDRFGVWGLFAWRWVTALVSFAWLWAAARKMGARGFVPLVVMVVCSLVWRARSQVRPETLAAMLLAAQVWILEARRHGGKDRAWWLVPVAWAWANVHNTWFLGIALTGVFLLRDLLLPRGASSALGATSVPGGRWRLAWVALAALAISFANPYGWRALWQPLDFFLHHRNEIVFRSIGELGPIEWQTFWIGLPVLMAGWPLLLLLRLRRRTFDLVEAILCVAFTMLALRAQRFLGFYALVAAPYVARDLEERLGSFAALARVPVALRAALAALACVVAGLPEWARPGLPLGVGFQWQSYPVAACDFMEARGVRGHGFNQFGYAGYMLYRFWPDRTRLPFMDIHQSGTRLDRDQYAWAQGRPEVWRELDGRCEFDYVLLSRRFFERNLLLNLLDADSTWALVFLDDVMALYVRRAGPLAGVARDFAYRYVPAGGDRLGALGAACARDSALRAATAAELERAALLLLSNIALQEARLDDARRLLAEALALNPSLGGVHWRLAAVALEEGRPREALAEIAREREISDPSASFDVIAGRAWRALGDRDHARAEFRNAIRRDSTNAEARDSLASIERGRGA
jgi:Tfp pilus assembly protein PilF